MSMKIDTNLEDMIQELAKRGEISNISLSMNSSHTKWRGGFAMCSVFGLSYAEDADPVKALKMALTSARLRTKRPPTDREIDAAEARSTAKIAQETVDADPPKDEYLGGIMAHAQHGGPGLAASAEDIDDLM